jgi:hypothetical protein
VTEENCDDIIFKCSIVLIFFSEVYSVLVVNQTFVVRRVCIRKLPVLTSVGRILTSLWVNILVIIAMS